MLKYTTTRRGALGSAGAAAFAFVLAMNGAFARSHPLADSVHVDVAPLLENSGEPTAGWVAREMPAALARAGVAGPISVRIDYVILGSSSGNSGVSGSTFDQIVGEVIVGGMARPLRAQSSYFPTAVDQPNFEQSNHDRVSLLVQSFAEWVARGA